MYTWSDFQIEIEDIPYEENTVLELQCPKCDHKRTKHDSPTLHVWLDEQKWFCKHCGFSGNLLQGILQEQTKPALDALLLNPFLQTYESASSINKYAIENFKKKKISEQTLEHFKVAQSKVYFPELQESINCLVYPYHQDQRLVNLVYFYGKYRNFEIGGSQICFNYDKINNDHTILVFDELEVFSLYEAGIENVISFFGGWSHENESIDKIKNKMLDFLSPIEEKIKDVKKITIALPNNEKSNELKEELLRRIGKERCWVVQPPEQGYCWNDVLIDYGKQKLTYLLDTAKPIPVRGIFDVTDIEDKLDELYYKGMRKGYSSGYDSLDAYYTVVPGQWTVLTGIPGHGKSNFLDAVMVKLAVHSDWRFGIFSPENQPIARHFASIMEKYHEAPFDLGKAGRITEEQKEEGKEWLQRHFSVILPHEDDNWSIDGVLELAKVLVYRRGIKGLVIDPWNELDHSRPNNQTETEYVSAVLTKIRQFARNYDVHVWLVAHPAKLYKEKDGKYPVPTPYDISGSAHYRNKADNAIAVWRNVGHEDQDVADIHVQKIRFKEVGRVGLVSLRYDSHTGSFVDDIDQVKRQNALNSGEVVRTQELRKRGF